MAGLPSVGFSPSSKTVLSQGLPLVDCAWNGAFSSPVRPSRSSEDGEHLLIDRCGLPLFDLFVWHKGTEMFVGKKTQKTHLGLQYNKRTSPPDAFVWPYTTRHDMMEGQEMELPVETRMLLPTFANVASACRRCHPPAVKSSPPAPPSFSSFSSLSPHPTRLQPVVEMPVPPPPPQPPLTCQRPRRHPHHHLLHAPRPLLLVKPGPDILAHWCRLLLPPSCRAR